MSSNLRVTYDKSFIQSSVNAIRKEINDSKIFQKQPEQLEKELDKLLASLKEKVQKPAAVITEKKKEEPQPIINSEYQNRIRQIHLHHPCANEQKRLRGIMNKFAPETINEFYEYERSYFNCIKAAKITLN